MRNRQWNFTCSYQSTASVAAVVAVATVKRLCDSIHVAWIINDVRNNWCERIQSDILVTTIMSRRQTTICACIWWQVTHEGRRRQNVITIWLRYQFLMSFHHVALPSPICCCFMPLLRLHELTGGGVIHNLNGSELNRFKLLSKWIDVSHTPPLRPHNWLKWNFLLFSGNDDLSNKLNENSPNQPKTKTWNYVADARMSAKQQKVKKNWAKVNESTSHNETKYKRSLGGWVVFTVHPISSSYKM